MRIRLAVAFGICLALAFEAAFGDERFGIPVYPGAKSDAATVKRCTFIDQSGKKAQCFRTSENFGKVLAFYRQQTILETTQLYASMPPAMQKNQVEGPKKSFDLCKKGSGDMCGFANPPAVRIMSPWSMNPNISPATKSEKYEHQDVLIVITDY